MILTPPSGFDGIIKTYGDITSGFEVKHIVSFSLPYPLYYGKIPVHSARCHSLCVDNFVGALTDIMNAGLSDQVCNYGGIYQSRLKRGSSKLSTHCWGIAIDLEPEKYPLGSKNRFPEEVISIFKKYGFFYGGDFAHRLDPMHFQLCTNY